MTSRAIRAHSRLNPPGIRRMVLEGDSPNPIDAPTGSRLHQVCARSLGVPAGRPDPVATGGSHPAA